MKNELKNFFNKAGDAARSTTLSLEKAVFRTKLGLLSRGETVSDDTFASAIDDATHHFGIEEKSFRDAFSLSKGAVDRWAHRANLPQPFVRPKILRWVREQL